MKKTLTKIIVFVCCLLAATPSANAQQRRPIDSQHPLWMIHVDVWNSADPQKIIDLIPADIRPYVCMNLSLSCGYDTGTNMYRMPRCAVRTYKSWATVCQHNNMWFTCQPASGGHTHIQDDDLVTFEYFFKTFPNFLGWNYAEQFWGFGEPGDESSSTEVSRLALFAKLVEMSHQYGGFLTISFCGSVYSHPLNPMGMMKRNKQLLQACKDYPEAILWLYKYTHPVCFYNNESVTFGPFISGLATNYGVRYDNCGWNDALNSILGKDHGKKYPGAAGIATVMEQTCVNGGAVWDGPELIWTEDFKNMNNSTVDGFTRRNWGTFDNFKGIWLDMWRQIINGNMYIPTREEVVEKTKIVLINDKNSGSDEDMYATWGSLYDGLYKQDDPFNNKLDGRYSVGQWQNNFCYLKKTGRYGAIPMVIDLYDDVARAIPVQVKKSEYGSRWGTIAKKTAEFDSQYPEVSTGDLYVNRFRNQLVTYTPYTYLNKKKTASASIPLQYNTCDTLNLTYGKLSSGYIREYADHIDFYLNNYRSDSTTLQTDLISIVGATEKPTYSLTKHTTGAAGYLATAFDSYDEATHAYTLTVKHMGPVNIKLNCAGAAQRQTLPLLPAEALPTPQQPGAYNGPIIIEAENMDYKNVKNVALTHSGWWASDMKEFAAMGYVEMGTSTSSALRHQLKDTKGGEYNVIVRYCATSKAGKMRAVVNGIGLDVAIEKVAKNDWHKAVFTVTLKDGTNDLRLNNTAGIDMIIDQIIYEPVGTPEEKFKVTVLLAENGQVTADVDEALPGQTVTLTIAPDQGFAIKELRMVNSVFFTMGKTIPVSEGDTQVTFVMPDDNVTIQPAFIDKTMVYQLDYSNVLNGDMPVGWRTTDGNSVRNYPTSNGNGPRTMAGFNGWQGKALYWRNTSAEYGRLNNYRLNLKPGDYKLTYVMAAWKGSPTYKVQILNESTGSQIATSATLTAAPNADGNQSATLTSAKVNTLQFNVKQQANYVIKFSSVSGGYTEFLLLECQVNSLGNPEGIIMVEAGSQQTVTIYDAAGRVRPALGRGLNIIRTSDGKTRKVFLNN